MKPPTKLERCATAPCKSCPYRQDVPSGIWHADEYSKLPLYDGDIVEQLLKGATAKFYCHQQDGKLCAGWVGAHGPADLLALRLWHATVHPSVFEYTSPIPLFKSGAEACRHGMRSIKRPPAAAVRMMGVLTRRRTRSK